MSAKKILGLLAAVAQFALFAVSAVVLFLPHGGIDTTREVELQKHEQYVREVHGDPESHPCENCGKPATHVVGYGGTNDAPDVVRWYCDQCTPPSYVKVRAGQSAPGSNAGRYIAVDVVLHALGLLLSAVILLHAIQWARGKTAAAQAQEGALERFERKLAPDDGTIGCLTIGMAFAYVAAGINLAEYFSH